MLGVLLRIPRARIFFSLIFVALVVFNCIDAFMVSRVSETHGRVDPAGFSTAIDRDTQGYEYSVLHLIGDATEYRYIPADLVAVSGQAGSGEISDTLLANADHVDLWYSRSFTDGSRVLAMDIYETADNSQMFATSEYHDPGRLRNQNLVNAGVFGLIALVFVLAGFAPKVEVDSIHLPWYLGFLKLLLW